MVAAVSVSFLSSDVLLHQRSGCHDNSNNSNHVFSLDVSDDCWSSAVCHCLSVCHFRLSSMAAQSSAVQKVSLYSAWFWALMIKIMRRVKKKKKTMIIIYKTMVMIDKKMMKWWEKECLCMLNGLILIFVILLKVISYVFICLKALIPFVENNSNNKMVAITNEL